MNGVTVQPPAVIDYSLVEEFVDHSTPYRHGPFLVGSNLYVGGIDDATNHYEVYKSTDGGRTWAIQDHANSLLVNGRGKCSTFDGDHTLYVFRVLGITTTGDVHTFDFSTDTWGPQYGSTATLTATGNDIKTAASFQSYGTLDPTKFILVTVQEFPVRRFRYQINNAGTWSGDTDLGLAFSGSAYSGFHVADIAIDTNGVAHVVLWVRTFPAPSNTTDTLYYFQVDTAGAASTPVSIYSVVANDMPATYFDGRAVIYRSESDELIVSIWKPASNGGPEIGVLRGTPSSAPVWTYQAIYNGLLKGITGWSYVTLAISQALSFSTVYALASGPLTEITNPSDTPVGFIALFIYDGTSWSAPKIIYDERVTVPVPPNFGIAGNPFGAVFFDAAKYIGIYGNGLLLDQFDPFSTQSEVIEYLDYPFAVTTRKFNRVIIGHFNDHMAPNAVYIG